MVTTARCEFWDLANGQIELTIEVSSVNTGRVDAVAVTPDGRRIVSGGNRTVQVWDLASGQLEHTLEGHTSWVYTVVVTQDNRRIVSGGDDGIMRVWNLASGQLERTVKRVGDRVAVTQDGRRIVSSSGIGGAVSVWDLASHTDEVLGDGSPFTEAGDSDQVHSIIAMAVAPDGRRIVSGGGRTVQMWDLANGRFAHTLEGITQEVHAVAVTPDGNQIILGGDRIELWGLASGHLQRKLGGYLNTVWAVAVTPDGGRIVSGSGDRTVRVWDLASGQLEHKLEGHTARYMR